jgi:hypothetical protein
MKADEGYISVDADGFVSAPCPRGRGHTSARARNCVHVDTGQRLCGPASIAFTFFFHIQIQGRNETLCVKKNNKKRSFVLHLIDIINVILQL